MILTEAGIKRVEGGNIAVDVKSEYLEYYSGDNTWAGLETEFVSYDESGNIDIEGHAEEFAADLDNEEYIFISPVEVQVVKENLGIKAPRLKISGETNSIAGSPNDMVYIEGEDSVIEGRGFVMDSLTGEFQFLSDVSGTMGKTEDAESLQQAPDSPYPETGGDGL